MEIISWTTVQSSVIKQYNIWIEYDLNTFDPVHTSAFPTHTQFVLNRFSCSVGVGDVDTILNIQEKLF